MSLVVIALDRYLALLNKSNARILQSKIFCLSGLFIVWSLGGGISSPMLFSYKLIEAYVVPEERVEEFYLAYMCMTDLVRKFSIEKLCSLLHFVTGRDCELLHRHFNFHFCSNVCCLHLAQCHHRVGNMEATSCPRSSKPI